MPRALGHVPLFFLLSMLAACGGHPTSGYYGRGHPGWGRGHAPPGTPEDPWGPYIRDAAGRFGVPERWVRAVMRQESGGRQRATSSAGAMGLMQVMPDTYAGLRERYGLGDDPYDPHDNILAGTAYIREMYDRYGAPGFLAAYNAGPNRVDDYLASGSPLPNETVNYLSSIAPRLGNSGPLTGPLAVYAQAGSYAGESEPPPPLPLPASVPVPAPPPLPAPPPAAAAAPVRGSGCDPNAAYDPDAPCTALPAPVPVGAVTAAPAPAAPAYDPDAAYDPRNSPPRFAPPQPEPQPPVMPPAARVQLAAAAVEIPSVPAGRWSIQVGAFANPAKARAEAEAALGSAHDLLGAARIEVPATTPFGGAVLYRARLTELLSSTAEGACARLMERRMACMVVPPGQGS